MTKVTALTRIERIRMLNDSFRTTFNGGRIVMTPGVSDLAPELLTQVLTNVRCYLSFDPDNDPYTEHDFGSFKVAATIYFFKIDYYAADMQSGSDDPADPEKTTRVLTIMRSDEY